MHKLRKTTRESMVVTRGTRSFRVHTIRNRFEAVCQGPKAETTIPEGATPASVPHCYKWKRVLVESTALKLHVTLDLGTMRLVVYAHPGTESFREYMWNGKTLRQTYLSVGASALTHGQQADVERALSTLRF